MGKKRRIFLTNSRQVRKYLSAKIAEIESIDADLITPNEIEKLRLIRSYIDALLKSLAIEKDDAPILALNGKTEIIIR